MSYYFDDSEETRQRLRAERNRNLHEKALIRASTAETHQATLRALVEEAAELLAIAKPLFYLDASRRTSVWLQRAKDALDSIPDLKQG